MEPNTPAATVSPAAPASPPTIEQMIESLKANGSEFVSQIESTAKVAFNRFVTQLGASIVLSPQEADDIAWATDQITAAAVLSIGADPKTLATLAQARLEALSVLANIEAIKAKGAEVLLTGAISQALGIVQQFVLTGERVLITALIGAAIGA